MNFKKSAWAEINLSNLRHNINEIRKAKNEKTRIMTVVKANAYGHGAIEVTKFLVSEGIDFFGVATLSEAIELRNNNINEDILILGFTDLDDVEVAVEKNIIVTIYDLESGKKISEIGKKMNKTIRVHLKIDTGMNRLGFKVKDNMDDIKKLYSLENVKVDGIFTHLATSDEKDKTFSIEQYNKFIEITEELKDENIDVRNMHISNSGAIIDMPELNLDIIRAGIMIYGYYPSTQVDTSNIKLKKVMTLKSKISNLKYVDEGETVGYSRSFKANKKLKIGTIPIGYGDGFTRLLSEKLYLNINGYKVKIIGNICMDQSMIDCTDIERISIKDTVTIFGEGEENNSADTLAEILGTINYEILCMIGRRISRIYIDQKVNKVVDYLTE